MFWWQSIELGLRHLGGKASLQLIYNEVRKIRAEQGDTLPDSTDAIIRREIEYCSTDSESWRGNRDLFFSVNGIGGGYWGLRELLRQSPRASDFDDDEGSADPERSEQTSHRIIRDTSISRRVKALHDFRCQVCGDTICLPDGRNYAEGHHIIPLGTPHNGPDITSNIVVVCPNHHAMLDFGCMPLSPEMLRACIGHMISTTSIEYHNSVIVSGNQSDEP